MSRLKDGVLENDGGLKKDILSATKLPNNYAELSAIKKEKNENLEMDSILQRRKEVRENNNDGEEEEERKRCSVGCREAEEKEVWSSPSGLLSLGCRLLPSHHMALSPRWQGWFLRGQSGLLLMSCFYTIVNMGPVGLFSLTYIVQAASFYEVMSLCDSVTGVSGLSSWSWLLLLLANFFLLDDSLQPLSPRLVTPVTAVLYLALLVYFVLSIRGVSQCLPRYCFFAWAHLASLLLAPPVALAVLSLRRGMVWYVFAFSVITINDIAAYMVGFFLGQTPLIVLSPKKTVEGYVGGGLVTLLLGPLFACLLQQYCPFLLCPTHQLTLHNCQLTHLGLFSGTPSPFLLHCLVISVFASTLGPFAGFFCSGFKRACNRKSFGSLIPGHGGVLDRCDCMFLMAAFTYLYLESVVY